jgi:hypothetical protein
MYDDKEKYGADLSDAAVQEYHDYSCSPPLSFEEQLQVTDLLGHKGTRKRRVAPIKAPLGASCMPDEPVTFADQLRIADVLLQAKQDEQPATLPNVGQQLEHGDTVLLQHPPPQQEVRPPDVPAPQVPRPGALKVMPEISPPQTICKVPEQESKALALPEPEPIKKEKTLSRRRVIRAQGKKDTFTDEVDMDMEGIMTESAHVDRCSVVGMLISFAIVGLYATSGWVRLLSLNEIPATRMLLKPIFRPGNFIPMPGLAMCVLGNRNMSLQHADFCRTMTDGACTNQCIHTSYSCSCHTLYTAHCTHTPYTKYYTC